MVFSHQKKIYFGDVFFHLGECGVFFYVVFSWHLFFVRVVFLWMILWSLPSFLNQIIPLGFIVIFFFFFLNNGMGQIPFW